MAKKVKQWYTLDNAGVLYAALQRREYSAIYRFSAVMTEKVDAAALQRAIDRLRPRFPGFFSCIKMGLFWYYLEPNDAPGPFVRPDVADPCRPMDFKEEHGWLVRFFVYDRRISIEVFHALSDGGGAIVFFRTLLAEYLRQLGHTIPVGPGICDLSEPPPREEMEDAYARYVGPRKAYIRSSAKAYPNVGTPEPYYTFHVTMGFVPVDALKAKAKSYGVSITEYLSAVLLWVLIEKQRRENPRRTLPVALAVPINLRAYFPSRTLRIFISTVRPSIDPRWGEYTFEEILQQVRHYMQLHIHRQELRAEFTGNVRFQTHPLLKKVPIVLKNPAMIFSYWAAGVRPYTMTYTNPGPFCVPREMERHIHHMEVILGQATQPKPNCATISYGNIMEITFAGTQKETDTERDFFRFLVQQGLSVKIESNRV